MKMKKTLAFMTAAAIGISSFAALASSAAAEEKVYGLNDVIWAKGSTNDSNTTPGFTLIHHPTKTNEFPRLNDNSSRKSTLTAESGLTEEYSNIFGKLNSWEIDYIDFWGTDNNRKGTVQAKIQAAQDQLNNSSFWKAYVLLRGGKEAPTIKISSGADIILQETNMNTDSSQIAGDGKGGAYYYAATASLPKGIFTAGKTYTVDWGGSLPSDIVAAAFAPVNAINAQVDTVYKADELFSNVKDMESITLDSDTSKYSAKGSPFGNVNTITNTAYTKYADRYCGTSTLKFDLSAGTYNLFLLEKEYNNQYIDIYSDSDSTITGNTLSDGDTVSGLYTDRFAYLGDNTDNKLIIRKIEWNISKSGTHYLTLTNTDDHYIRGFLALILASPIKQGFVGATIQNGQGSGTLSYSGSSYQRFNDPNKGAVADAYLTSINPQTYTASNLKWYITSSSTKTIDTNAPAISGSSDVYFGLIITGTTDQLNSITSVTLE